MQRFFGDGVLMMILWVVFRIVLDALMFSALSCILHAPVLARFLAIVCTGMLFDAFSLIQGATAS